MLNNKGLICQHPRINMSIPCRKLDMLFYKTMINDNEVKMVSQLNDKLESNINILLNAKSVVERILLKKI